MNRKLTMGFRAIYIFVSVAICACVGQNFQPNIWTIDTEPTNNVNVSGMTFFHTRSDTDLWNTSPDKTPDTSFNTFTNFLADQREDDGPTSFNDDPIQDTNNGLQMDFPLLNTAAVQNDPPVQKIPTSLANTFGSILSEDPTSSRFDSNNNKDTSDMELSKFGILQNDVQENRINSRDNIMLTENIGSLKPNLQGSSLSLNKNGPSMEVAGSFVDHSHLPMFRVKSKFKDRSLLKLPSETTTTTESSLSIGKLDHFGDDVSQHFETREKTINKIKFQLVTTPQVPTNFIREQDNITPHIDPIPITTTPLTITTPADRLKLDDIYPDVPFPIGEQQVLDSDASNLFRTSSNSNTKISTGGNNQQLNNLVTNSYVSQNNELVPNDNFQNLNVQTATTNSQRKTEQISDNNNIKISILNGRMPNGISIQDNIQTRYRNTALTNREQMYNENIQQDDRQLLNSNDLKTSGHLSNFNSQQINGQMSTGGNIPQMNGQLPIANNQQSNEQLLNSNVPLMNGQWSNGRNPQTINQMSNGNIQQNNMQISNDNTQQINREIFHGKTTEMNGRKGQENLHQIERQITNDNIRQINEQMQKNINQNGQINNMIETNFKMAKSNNLLINRQMPNGITKQREIQMTNGNGNIRQLTENSQTSNVHVPNNDFQQFNGQTSNNQLTNGQNAHVNSQQMHGQVPEVNFSQTNRLRPNDNIQQNNEQMNNFNNQQINEQIQNGNFQVVNGQLFNSNNQRVNGQTRSSNIPKINGQIINDNFQQRSDQTSNNNGQQLQRQTLKNEIIQNGDTQKINGQMTNINTPLTNGQISKGNMPQIKRQTLNGNFQQINVNTPNTNIRQNNRQIPVGMSQELANGNVQQISGRISNNQQVERNIPIGNLRQMNGLLQNGNIQQTNGGMPIGNFPPVNEQTINDNFSKVNGQISSASIQQINGQVQSSNFPQNNNFLIDNQHDSPSSINQAFPNNDNTNVQDAPIQHRSDRSELNNEIRGFTVLDHNPFESRQNIQNKNVPQVNGQQNIQDRNIPQVNGQQLGVNIDKTVQQDLQNNIKLDSQFQNSGSVLQQQRPLSNGLQPTDISRNIGNNAAPNQLLDAQISNTNLNQNKNIQNRFQPAANNLIPSNGGSQSTVTNANMLRRPDGTLISMGDNRAFNMQQNQRTFERGPQSIVPMNNGQFPQNQLMNNAQGRQFSQNQFFSSQNNPTLQQLSQNNLTPQQIQTLQNRFQSSNSIPFTNTPNGIMRGGNFQNARNNIQMNQNMLRNRNGMINRGVNPFFMNRMQPNFQMDNMGMFPSQNGMFR